MTGVFSEEMVERARALLDAADQHAREIAEPLFLNEREALRAALASQLPEPQEQQR